MSPLWSDEALAQAGWAKAVERGVVDESDAPVRTIHPSWMERVRRPARSKRHSFAL
jgi:hypothetical protein